MPLPLGFKHSDQTIQNMQLAQRKRFDSQPISEESKRKMSVSAKRKPLPSPEAKQRMSSAHKARWARHRAIQASSEIGISVEEYEKEVAGGRSWCKKCRTFKDINDFSRKTVCLSCIYAKNDAWYKRNRETVRLRMRERYAANTNGARDKNKAIALRKYGVDIDWYLETLDSQKGGCAICGSTDPGEQNTHFAIDHNHSCCPARKTACDTCRRGLLCTRCNNCLERLDTIPDWTTKAVAYLRKYGSLA